jgi:2-polyprenyl-3-methyl-5-hydroxy-6-metoxy-1,4-benzoquinol methylase
MFKKNIIKKTKFYRNLLKDLSGNIISEKFGVNSSWKWYNDPRQFFISLARYKFVSKILSGKKKVLEVGCSDGLNSRIVKQEVEKLDLCDVDFNLIKNAKENLSLKWKVNIFFHDFLKKKLNKNYNAIYLLDVLEHISKKDEKKFIKNILESLNKNGILIIGMPSKEFQKYSRPIKISGHINCKTAKELKILMNKFFHNVIIFSMNDELVHTGFEKMSCYFFAVCIIKKKTT